MKEMARADSNINDSMITQLKSTYFSDVFADNKFILIHVTNLSVALNICVSSLKLGPM